MSAPAAKSPKDFTILVVDDEDLLREAVSFDFRRRGYNVLGASCGRDALALLQDSRVDVVISDVRMPNGNGLELLEAIKKNNVFVPVVIFITGFADISLEEAYDMGADAVFPKPFDREALREAVERALQPVDTRFNRKGVRVNVELTGELVSAANELTSSFQVKNMGRGGFFAEVKGDLPSVKEVIDFSITLDQGKLMTVTGRGVVRWVREPSDGAHMPSGCGVEFLQLEESCRKPLLELINLMKTKSFIPLK